LAVGPRRFNSLPRIALVPLITMIFGFGLLAKIVVAGTIVFFIAFFTHLSAAGATETRNHRTPPDVKLHTPSITDPIAERRRSMKLRRPAIAASLALLASVVLVGAAGALEVGQQAPDFTLNGTDGKPVKLSELTAKGPVVIYTFIAAFTGT
jgi:hypothetical protein